MKKINMKEIDGVCGGNPALFYPIIGCGMITAMDYVAADGDMEYGDMAMSCGKGMIHGGNLAIGITTPIRNPYVRYAAGMAYSRYAPGLVDNFVRNSRSVAMSRQSNSTFLGGFSD